MRRKVIDFGKGLFWGALFAVAMSAFLVWSVANIGEDTGPRVDS